MFLDILEWKTLFYAIKTTSLKKSKNCDFSKGIVMIKNLQFLLLLDFREKKTAESVSRYHRKKKTPF